MSMIKETIENIKNNREIKENLFLMRDELRQMQSPEKNGEEDEVWLSRNKQDEERVLEMRKELEQLFFHEDPKVRRCVAQILSCVKSQESLDAIYRAYREEETLFIREDYLKALAQLDYKSLIPELKQRLDELLDMEMPEEHRGHLMSETDILFEMLTANNALAKHKFTGLTGVKEILLTTKEGLQDVTIKQLPKVPRKKVPGGVMVKTDDLDALFEIRTYEELLFYMGISHEQKAEPEALAKEIFELGVAGFLKNSHEQSGPMGVRIGLSDPMERSKKGAYVKRIGQELTRLSKGKLINTTSGYEAEIRLIPNSEGGHRVMVKLFTLPRHRFDYRKEAVASSIKPYLAATLLKLAGGYLKTGAQVLDPYCGVGTMLIERRAVTTTGDCYGVDSFGEAIQKARTNSEKIGPYIHYIQRDFEDFTHSYLFDEIITDMPVATRNVGRQEIRRCYELLFKKGKELLKEGGIMVVYGNEHGLMKQQLRQNKEYSLLREYGIEQRLDTHLYVIGYRTSQGKKNGNEVTK